VAVAERRPEPPRITVVDPRSPGTPVDVLEAAPESRPPRLSPRTRRLLGGAVLLAVAVVVAVNARDAHQRSQLAAESKALHLTVGVGTALPPGRPAPVVDAVVSVVVHNGGRASVRLVSEQVDGGPVQRSDGPTVAADEARALAVRWRVRCAEVGQVRGPLVLALKVAAPRGEHVVRFPLVAGASTFHAAAVAACAGG
jgi:hypothetical protein